MSSKEKRSLKAESKNNNKGLIGAATMLSFVGMLNIMSPSSENICGQYNENHQYQTEKVELIEPRVLEGKNDLNMEDFEEQLNQSGDLLNEWTLDNNVYDGGVAVVNEADDEFAFAGDFAPAKPDSVVN